MSKFNNIPYIETILSEVSGENKAKLLNNINGKNAAGNGAISFTLVKNVAGFTSLSSGITPVAFKYSDKITWKGYAVKTTSYLSFITFKTGIDLELADVYSITSGTLAFRETVTADNLRALLREDAYIDASELPTPEAELPEAPVDASTKTYVLELVNGVKTWVEKVVEQTVEEPSVEEQTSEPAGEGD